MTGIADARVSAVTTLWLYPKESRRGRQRGLPGRLCRSAGAGGSAGIGKMGPRPESGISKVVRFLVQSGDAVAFSRVR